MSRHYFKMAFQADNAELMHRFLLDGRISLPSARTGKFSVPAAIRNARDWRLFQELAACADALVTSGRYVRDLPHGVSARSFPVSETLYRCANLLADSGFVIALVRDKDGVYLNAH